MAALRFTALYTIVGCVYGHKLGEMPSQTLGVGLPLLELLPTPAPELEVVKRSLGKRALTNTCSEWTLEGLGGGTPLCGFSQTCLFTSANDGYMYEGCGQTSLPYEWVTKCWPYTQNQTLSAPASEIYCPRTAPACGYYAFVYDFGQTFINLGCSITSYSSTARPVSSVTANLIFENSSRTATSGSALATNTPGSGFFSTSSRFSSTDEPTPTRTGSGLNPSSTRPVSISPNIKKKKFPLAAVIGAVVGGVVLIIIIILTWLCIRRSRRKKATKLQATQQASATPLPDAQFSELGGGGLSKPAATYKPQDKPFISQKIEGYSPMSQGGSPPPVYTHPPYVPVSGMYNELDNTRREIDYTELESTGRQSGTVSPGVTAAWSPTPSELQGQQRVEPRTHTPVIQEMAGQGFTGQQQQHGHSLSQMPAVHEINGQSHVPHQQGSQIFHAPGLQEMNGQGQQYGDSRSHTPAMQELSGTGGIVRKPVRKSAGTDMSGAPMSEDYSPSA